MSSIQVLQFNKIVTSLLALRGYSRTLDEADVDSIIKIALPLDEGKSPANNADYLRVANELRGKVDKDPIDGREKLVQDVEKALQAIIPETFEVSKGTEKVKVKTANFIDFLLKAHIAQISSITDLKDTTEARQNKLLAYPNNTTSFGPALKSSVDDPGILQDPVFLKQMFTDFLGTFKDDNGKLALILSLYQNLNMEKDSLKSAILDHGRDLIHKSLNDYPGIAGSQDEGVKSFLYRTSETNIRNALLRFGNPYRAQEFARDVSKYIGDLKGKDAQELIPCAKSSYSALVSTYNLKEILKLEEIQMFKEIYSRLASVNSLDLNEKPVNDKMFAINRHCTGLNGAVKGEKISSLVNALDDEASLASLATALKGKTELKDQAEIIKTFLLDQNNCPKYIRESNLARELMGDLEQIIAPAVEPSPPVAQPESEPSQLPPSIIAPVRSDATPQVTPLTSQQEKFNDLVGRITKAVENDLNDDGKKLLAKIFSSAKTDHLEDKHNTGLEALVIKLEQATNKKERIAPLETIFSGAKRINIIDDDTFNKTKAIGAQLHDIDHLSPGDQVQYFKFKSGGDEYDNVCSELVPNLANSIQSANITKDELGAVIESAKNAPSWKESRRIYNEFFTKINAQGYINLPQYQKDVLIEDAIQYKWLDPVLDALEPASANQPEQPEAASSQKTTPDKTDKNWWDWTCENIPLVGLISSLVVGGLGGLFATGSENKKPGFIALTIGAIGAIGTGIYMWMNSETPKTPAGSAATQPGN